MNTLFGSRDHRKNGYAVLAPVAATVPKATCQRVDPPGEPTVAVSGQPTAKAACQRVVPS